MKNSNAKNVKVAFFWKMKYALMVKYKIAKNMKMIKKVVLNAKRITNYFLTQVINLFACPY